MTADLRNYKELQGGGVKSMISSVTLGVGLVGFTAGMYLECLADYQKFSFKTDRSNTKRWRWCDKGLWKYARHPNYFAEVLIWASIFLMAFPIAPIWTIVSPVFVWWLLRYKTGVPLLEAEMKKKYWSHPDFEKYMAETNLMVPIPSGKKFTGSTYGIGSDMDDV